MRAVSLELQRENARLKRDLATVTEHCEALRRDLRRVRRSAQSDSAPAGPRLSEQVRLVAMMLDELRAAVHSPEIPLAPAARARIAEGSAALGRLVKESERARDARPFAVDGLAARCANLAAHWHALLDMLWVLGARQCKLTFECAPEPPGVRDA